MMDDAFRSQPGDAPGSGLPPGPDGPREQAPAPGTDQSWLPVLVLLAAACLGAGGWWVFPSLQSAVARQDCVARGRTDC